MHIQVIIAMFAVLFSVGLVEDPTDKSVDWIGHFSAQQTLMLLFGSFLIFIAVARMSSRLLLKRLEGQQKLTRAMLRQPAKYDLRLQILLLLLFLVQLTLGGWCKLVYLDWHLSDYVLLWELGLLAPFLFMVVAKWHCFYPINQFIRTHVVSAQLAEGIAARPVWTRNQYLSFQIRNGLLIVLVPLLVILSFRDLADRVLDPWLSRWQISPNMQEALFALVVLLIFVLAPFLLRFIWSTRSLPAGPLRERLSQFSTNLKLKHRDILLWNTYSAVANAAVMGLFAPVRYVLLSDALIENMSDEQIEAVFGHETGHVKHHHILFLVLFVFALGSVLMLLAELMALALNQPVIQHYLSATVSDIVFYGWAMLLAGGWFVLFGWVSRRFEWQADIYAAQAVDRIGSNGSGDEQERSETPLGFHGARTVGAALERIALLNGMSIFSRSWRHASIANRIRFLRRLATEQGALAKFQRLLIGIKITILLALVVGVCGLWWLSKLEAM